MTNMFTKRSTVPTDTNTGPEGIPSTNTGWNFLRGVKKEDADLAKQVDDLKKQVAALKLEKESFQVDTKPESQVELSEKITEELSKLKIKEQLAANVENTKTLFAQIESIKKWARQDRDLIQRSVQGCNERISTTTLAQEKALKEFGEPLQSDILAVRSHIGTLSESIKQILGILDRNSKLIDKLSVPLHGAQAPF
jgi:methyl-accepting chemotaxis protein